MPQSIPTSAREPRNRLENTAKRQLPNLSSPDNTASGPWLPSSRLRGRIAGSPV